MTQISVEAQGAAAEAAMDAEREACESDAITRRERGLQERARRPQLPQAPTPPPAPRPPQRMPRLQRVPTHSGVQDTEACNTNVSFKGSFPAVLGVRQHARAASETAPQAQACGSEDEKEMEKFESEGLWNLRGSLACCIRR
eukprot:TRINITY_DN66985_c0_g1_i1.p1 TRINITY_DN66985_c0_g1~~TRINITY_DN66985_c0_g1_i1.p1  ORF type:complete len:142 (+),score=31.34 TRINITY_DN66985_c0_g1_i1:217-642(+)